MGGRVDFDKVFGLKQKNLTSHLTFEPSLYICTKFKNL
jgi:hypothetical protein